MGALEVLIATVAYAGTSWLIVFSQLLVDGAFLFAWVLAGAGWGALLAVPLQHRESDSAGDGILRVVTAAALGLALLSLATLGLGLTGWLNRGVGFGLIVTGLFAGAAVVRRRWGAQLSGDIGTPLRAWMAKPAVWHWLWLATLPLLAVALVGACIPPGMLWTPDEPHGYDVVGYHFQIPREWYELGRIVPLQHNVFSHFPFGVEMHYLLAMHLRGGPWKGMYLAQLMHVAHVVLAVVAVYGFARSLAKHRAAALAAALTASAVPWLTLLAPVGYNEGGLLLYGTLAIGWALRAIDAPPRTALARFALAGAMAGFACGVKLTAVPMLLAAVPVATVAASPRSWRYVWIFVVVGAVVFSPWALRNVAWTGNPVFPEGMRLLGRGHFTEVQVQRWEKAHSRRPDQASAAARLGSAWRQIVADWRFGYVPLALGVISAAMGFRRRESRALAALLVLLLFFWLGFTHLQGRFFVLAVPIVALLVATIDWGKFAPGVAGVMCISVWASWSMVHVELARRLYGASPMVAVIGVDDFSGLNPPEVAAMPPEDTLVLIGEGRAFWYPRSMSRLRYRTVFDVPSGDDIVGAWRGGAPRGPGEWELINPSELNRYADTYWGIPQLPPELKGRVDPIVAPPAAR